MKGISTFNNKSMYRKGSRSMERINPIKKMNLSLMDEKLHLLNSDIEELYKKYTEEKSIHQRKEKSEQNLSSRIEFLIDEERKIKNKIENNVIQSDLIIKNRSLKRLKSPKIETNIENSESNRYHIMDNNGEEIPYKKNQNYHKYAKIDFKKIKHINNLNNIENKCKNKNGINGSNLYNKKSNSVEKNNGNGKNNVTNNVCIIINSPKKNESEENPNYNYNFADVSFSNSNKNNKIKAKNFNNTSEINGNYNYQKEKINIIRNLLNNKKNNNSENKEFKNRNNNEINMDKSDNNINNEEKENENLMKINNEINFIKMRLALKLKVGLKFQAQKLKDAVTQTEQFDDNSPILNKGNNTSNDISNFIKYNVYKIESSEDEIITPTFKQKVNTESKDKSNQSLRSILYSKQRNLLRLVKEIDIKKKILRQRQKKISVESKQDDSQKISLDTDDKNKKHVKKINQRSYSKTDNNINKLKSKVFKTFNRDNIANNLNSEKMNRMNSSNKRNNSSTKKGLKYEINNFSIDSDESILCRINRKRIINLKKNISMDTRAQNSIFDIMDKNKNKNMRFRYNSNDDKVYYEYDSTPNLINNMNFTFNQSIEKKRELLGLPQNIRDKIRSKILKIDSLLKNNNDIIKQKENNFRQICLNKNKIEINNRLKNKIKEIHKKEEKIWNRNNIANKSLRSMYNKKYSKRIINNRNYKKSETNDNNYNKYNIHKKRNFNSGNYPLSNNYKDKTNSIQTTNQIFNDAFNIYARFSSSSNDKNFNKNTSNGSLTSMFSNQTNMTNRTNRTQKKIKIYNTSVRSENKENYNNSKSNDINNSTNENKYGNINKYLKNIKLIKKGQNSIKKEETNKNIVRNLKDEIKYMTDTKLYEKEIKIKRQLAAIRRINQIKEDYKKKGTQLNIVNKRYLNKFNNNNNSNSSSKTKNFQFQTIRRLSEIKKRPRISFTKQNINANKSKNKSKSNRSLIKINNGNFKFFNS